ncbi:MAG TPA: thiamine pyrophosphate-binding protein [Bryobacteraceae bacterium]|jgi:acetolactate synthase-1/2/3 large subunit|nr:thiamine pyrophosphate-binding protein [Bryobacteraceae bacterium]
MKLSDYVMRFIAAEGVRHVFLVTGGGAMHLNASLAQCRDLEAVCNSHEQASAMAAENYAKATNNLGVALVTTGPGGTNAITGVAGAWLDSTPVLVISGQVKRPDRMFSPDGTPLGMRQLGVQEVDIVSIAKPITKYAVTVLDPSSIRYHLEKAVWLARNGRPGPVWIDIPLDVQASPIDESDLRPFDPVEIETAPGCDLPAKVRETIDALNHAQRPLIFVGNGVRLAHAEEDFRRLFGHLGVPVEATWCAADIISSEDPLFVGRPGSLASRGANFALQNCDFLLILGARMDFAITGYAPERLARAAHKTMVDIDPAEIRKLAPYIQTEVPADAGDFLREMLLQISAVRPKDRTCWNKRCAEWKTRYPVVLPEHRQSRERVSIFHLAEVIGQETSPEDLMVSGNAGSGIEIFLFACPTRVSQRIYHMAGLGAMGCGLPMSIGVCLAGGRKRTVCVDGDGGFQFNIQELATVRQLDLPIKFFILNNDGYASIRASQKAFFGSPQVGCDESTGLYIPPLAKVADAYRIPFVRISTQERLREEVRRVLEMPGPVLCDVEVIPDEARVPRLSSMQRPDGSLVSKPLEDLYPFLDRDEFYSNMIVAPLPE